MIGAAMMKAGGHVVLLEGLKKTGVFIVYSPLVGLALGMILMLLLMWIVFRIKNVKATNKVFRKLQLVFASVILLATSIAFVLEVMHMIEIRNINLPDLLLLFIYLEVIGMVTSYWRTLTIRLTYPLFISITALSRLIILQKKDIDPSTLVYEAGAILLLAIAIVILKFRRSKFLGIKLDKDEI